MRSVQAEGQEPVSAMGSLFAAIIRRDVDEILRHYLHSPRLLIFLEGPDSKVEGWDEAVMRQAWTDLLSRVTFSRIELCPDARTGASENLGWVSGTTRMTYLGSSQSTAIMREARGTWILERQHGRWLIVAEHVSFPVATPYPASQAGT